MDDCRAQEKCNTRKNKGIKNVTSKFKNNKINEKNHIKDIKKCNEIKIKETRRL